MTHIFISCSKQNEQREQYKLAIMQMGVVAVFVLCNFLAMVSNILEMCSIEAFSVITVSNLLVTINSSINLFVYCAFRERFRTELKRMICELMRGVTKYFTSNIKFNHKSQSHQSRSITSKVNYAETDHKVFQDYRHHFQAMHISQMICH